MHQHHHFVTSLLVIAFVSAASAVLAQPIFSEVDSLPIVKAGQIRHVYTFNRGALGTIVMKSKDPVNISDTKQQHVGGGVLTLLTGFGTGSSEQATWRWPNELSSSNQSHSWQVPLVFKGEFSKSSERIRNDDGSFSIQQEKGIRIAWNDGAFGFIIKQGDTLGIFEIRRAPVDSLSTYWLSRIEADRRAVTKALSSYEERTSHQDFTINGVFNKKEFTMITGGWQYRSVILIENKPVAVVQGHPYEYIIIKKSERIHPYLLFERNAPESRDDLVMLGLLSMMLARRVATNYLGL